MDDLPVWIAALAGIAVAAFAALCYFLVADPPASGRQPVEAPPPVFRHAWRLVGAAAHYCRPWLSWQGRRRTEALLVQAGLRHALDAAHVLGAQWLCGALAAALAAAVALSLDAAAMTGMGAVAGAAALGVLYPRIWLRDRIRARRAAVVRALPFALDMTTLCIEAGLNPGAALQQAALKGPPGPLRDELRRALGDIRTGVPRAHALRDMAERLNVPEVRTWTATLAQADALGMSLAPMLRAQSEQRRTERFLRAEQLAMEAPVKMLFPLLACIFPCSFLIIAFPIGVKLMDLAW